MLIRYHLFYYAVGCLLVVLGKVFHPLFYLFYGGYLLWMIWRLGWKYCIILLFISIGLFLYQIEINALPDTVSGQVIKVSEKYCYFKTDFGVIKLYHEEELSYHDDIEVEMESIEMNENTNDHAFNEKLYLYGQGIYYKGRCQKLISRQSHETFYHWVESRFSKQENVSDYQRLFLLGERSESIQEDYQQLSQLSLVHLFALSGMHIHILFIALQRIFGLFVQQRFSRIMSYLCMAIYIFSIPMQISLYRAFFVLVLYDLFKKWFHELDVLSFLVMISLFYNSYIIYNISFVFSYFVYFIVILTQRLPHQATLIYLSTLPIILNLNYQISLISLLITQFLTPFVEIFYCLSALSILFLWTTPLLTLCVTLFQSIIAFLDVLNVFLVFSKPNLLFIFLFYILFFQIIYHLELKQSIQKYISIMIALFISFSFYSQYKIYGEVTMIDVGQGDCTLIRLPMNQGNILIDTGGIKDYDLATQTIIPYLKSVGIKKLDYVYISHDDYDHCGALESLKENFPINHIIEHYEKHREIGCATIDMIENQKVYTNTNDQSLIMYVQLPAMYILLTGDASTEVENDLLNQLKELNVDVLKVSHHGSKTASSPQFLDAISPSIAMIGVKKNNLYHHPSNEVIDRLNRKNITILRTDEDGMFHIRFYGKSRYILR